MPVENPILGHFRAFLPFSTGNNSSTKPIFQSNLITVTWRMYRGKGFVLNFIGNETLLASYYQLKTHFFAIVDTKWVATGAPVGPQWAPSGHPVGTQWAPSGHQVGANWRDTRLTGSIGAGQ